jgi:outer membrane protein OmpA-like peptidoglycan-associated protein
MSRALPIRFAASAAAAITAFTMLSRGAQASEVELSRYDSLPAQVGDFALKMEPGIAIALTDPQARLFETGVGETIKALWVTNEYMELGPSATFLTLPAEASGGKASTAWTLGGSIRFRPRTALRTSWVLSPWADVDVLYVRTGQRNHTGFAGAAGLAFPIGQARVFWIGPFVRYLQVLQRDRPGFDERDPKILSAGVSLEVSFGSERLRAVPAVTQAPPLPTITTVSCPDQDQDGVPDNADRCPAEAGPMEEWGCPAPKKLVVQPHELKLSEKIFFAWNQAILARESFPVLDQVVHTLNDNPRFRAQVEGHASSDGAGDHNQALSERRADAVLAYLVAHGIDKRRLVSKGFGDSFARDDDSTVVSREINRRVEFLIYFTILIENGD